MHARPSACLGIQIVDRPTIFYFLKVLQSAHRRIFRLRRRPQVTRRDVAKSSIRPAAAQRGCIGTRTAGNHDVVTTRTLVVVRILGRLSRHRFRHRGWDNARLRRLGRLGDLEGQVRRGPAVLDDDLVLHHVDGHHFDRFHPLAFGQHRLEHRFAGSRDDFQQRPRRAQDARDAGELHCGERRGWRLGDVVVRVGRRRRRLQPKRIALHDGGIRVHPGVRPQTGATAGEQENQPNACCCKIIPIHGEEHTRRLSDLPQ